ncbi:enoyl-CoA hydratase-related protein [uncultured Piscinibacter sp.]|mgnify:CR=1 FL=1|uniref:enoyl-CoA hydratase/isomerase family protein n=1 Tax=uncultured Piscinibacter sp. TaxID=1131835 RepID=UPI0026264D4E|nr:enoyl-CoA hydratase-related protein [uncultured Piscinibacter sp.]
MAEAGTTRDEDVVLLRHDGAIATVTLNRPDKLNALTKPMWRRLAQLMRELSADDGVRCVVLRGAGGKAFAPGNDIAEFPTERADFAQGKAYGAILHDALGAIADCRHPTLALIEGICVGGGLEIAALCDLRLCNESARFGAPINKLGLVMAHAELAALVQLAGRSVALEMLLEGRVFGAREALDKRLVNRVLPDADLEREAYACAARIAAGAPLAARWHKQFLRELGAGQPLTEAQRDEGFRCYDSEDFRIGVRAFLDKAVPEFVGR